MGVRWWHRGFQEQNIRGCLGSRPWTEGRHSGFQPYFPLDKSLEGPALVWDRSWSAIVTLSCYVSPADPLSESCSLFTPGVLISGPSSLHSWLHASRRPGSHPGQADLAGLGSRGDAGPYKSPYVIPTCSHSQGPQPSPCLHEAATVILPKPGPNLPQLCNQRQRCRRLALLFKLLDCTSPLHLGRPVSLPPPD